MFNDRLTWIKGQSCLVLEDLVTTGGSVLEVVESLRSEGFESV